MDVNYIALAIPFFFLLIGLEYLVARHLGREVYRLNDAVNDLSCGMLQQLLVLFLRAALVAGYVWLYYAFRLFDIPMNAVWAWILCLLGVDFCYYWFHRLSHEVNFLWAAHVVHHQSEEYNLAVALRQSAFQPIFSSFFYWPLALLGFPPVMFLTIASFHTLYQFWIHTRVIGRMGPLEWVLMTPSHHRVHHGRNPKYIDKNHGGTFIFWDKWFSTFQAEEDEPVYGITKPLASWNPLWANVHYWVELARAAKRTRAWSDKWRMFLRPPGWHPADLGGFQAPPEVSRPCSKFHTRVPAGMKGYLFVQFSLTVAATTVLIFSQAQWQPVQVVVAAIFIAWSLLNFGGLLEGKSWSYSVETVRLASAPILLLATASHFIGLGVIMLAFIPWLRVYRSFFAEPLSASA